MLAAIAKGVPADRRSRRDDEDSQTGKGRTSGGEVVVRRGVFRGQHLFRRLLFH